MSLRIVTPVSDTARSIREGLRIVGPGPAVMRAARRYDFLEWAKRRGVFFFEDDFVGVVRFVGRGIAALAALEPVSNVIFWCTLASSLFPSLGLGFL